MFDIKISELNPQTIVTFPDFFPLVNSGSMTTYRVALSAVNTLWAASGSAANARSASYSISASHAVFSDSGASAISASYATQSDNAINANTASLAKTSSYALTASFVQNATLTSASYTTTASFSYTASYALSASKAVSASYALSASYSGQSATASYLSPTATASLALTASYAMNAPVQAGVPSGMVMAFAGTTPPAGWLECNGAILNMSAYPSLGAILLNSYGGDGVSTFKVPDLRGWFIRGWSHGASVDTGRAINTYQTTDTQTHWHGTGFGPLNNDDPSMIYRPYSNLPSTYFTKSYVACGECQGSNPRGGNYDKTGNLGTTNQIVVGGESRPGNVSMMYCIKT